MQVQQRQHLSHLGALAAPGRQDHRAETDPLAGDQTGAAVIHPRRPHRDRTRGSHHLALASMAVADHQPPATLVPLGQVRGEVIVDLGLQGGGQHPPGALAHDRIQVQAQLVMCLGVGDYTQHAAFLPRRRSPRRRFQDLSSGKVRRAPISRPHPQLQVIPPDHLPLQHGPMVEHPEGPVVTAGQGRSAAAWCRLGRRPARRPRRESPGCGERAPQSRGLVRVPRDGQGNSSRSHTRLR